MTAEVFLYPRLDSKSLRNLDKYKAASPRVRVRLCKQSIIQVKREVLAEQLLIVLTQRKELRI